MNSSASAFEPNESGAAGMSSVSFHTMYSKPGDSTASIRIDPPPPSLPISAR